MDLLGFYASSDFWMIQLDKQYEPGEVEKRWGQFWQEKNFFHADETSDLPAYSIVIPPPNITGRLHIGHAFNNTLIIENILIS